MFATFSFEPLYEKMDISIIRLVDLVVVIMTCKQPLTDFALCRKFSLDLYVV